MFVNSEESCGDDEGRRLEECDCLPRADAVIGTAAGTGIRPRLFRRDCGGATARAQPANARVYGSFAAVSFTCGSASTRMRVASQVPFRS